MKLPVIAVAVLLIATPLPAFSADIPLVPLGSMTMSVASVTAREASGRAARFIDARNREFAVRYDSKQRVEAVESTRAPNVLDIVSIRYADAGQLLSVRYRTGYSIFFDHRPNGSQVIRDTNGAGIVRTGQSYQSIGQAEGETSVRLFESVGSLESLLLSLKPSGQK